MNDTRPPQSAIQFTHPERLYWPDDGVTKEGLADYYAQVWKQMAPFVVNRPLALLRRPEVRYADLAPFDPDRPPLPPDVAEQGEISIKYAGYIQRQLQEVEELRRMEGRALPPELDYAAIQGLRLEAREKLNAVRPLNIGQAGRISGVSPADVAALMIYLEKP